MKSNRGITLIVLVIIVILVASIPPIALYFIAENSASQDVSMKILVNSGDDGIVAAPIEEIDNKGVVIDWGDGTKERLVATQETLNNVTEVASTTGIDGLQIATVPEIGNVEHEYYELNKEYTITITGKTSNLCQRDENDKILKILDWGELGAEEISFKGCKNLTTIASPRKNSFKNVTDFDCTFSGCTSLESIPSDLFKNCKNVTRFKGTFENCTSLTSIPSNLFDDCTNVSSFKETFYNCSSLTGNSIKLWKDGKREKNEITETTGGEYCYYNCTNLSDYSEIPESWKAQNLEPEYI